MYHLFNIDRIKVINKVLAKLKRDFVFVGGAVVSLYVDRLSEEVRPAMASWKWAQLSISCAVIIYLPTIRLVYNANKRCHFRKIRLFKTGYVCNQVREIFFV